jgi:predicted phage-related endonuclease
MATSRKFRELNTESLPFTIEKYHTTQEWLEHRGIGGSDAAVIMGLSPKIKIKSTIDQIITGQKEPMGEKYLLLTQLGHYLEPFIATRLIELGMKIDGPCMTGDIIQFRSKEHPFMTYTPDGWCVSPTEHIIELKSPLNSERWNGRWSPSVRSAVCQAAYGGMITGARKATVAVLMGKERIDIYNETFSEEQISQLKEKTLSFFNDQIMPRLDKDPERKEHVLRQFKISE